MEDVIEFRDPEINAEQVMARSRESGFAFVLQISAQPIKIRLQDIDPAVGFFKRGQQAR